MVEKTRFASEEAQQLVLFSHRYESTEEISRNSLEAVKNAFDITCKQAKRFYKTLKAHYD